MMYRIDCTTVAVVAAFCISGCGTQQQKESADLRSTTEYVMVGQQEGLTKVQQDIFQSCVDKLNAHQREAHMASTENEPLYLAKIVPLSKMQKSEMDANMNRAKVSTAGAVGIGIAGVFFPPAFLGAMLLPKAMEKTDEATLGTSAPPELRQEMQMRISTCYTTGQVQQYR
ncbi:MAG: hypothetical protein AB2603_11105 [Candidatus Thiodiazotropha endolucinida]